MSLAAFAPAEGSNAIQTPYGSLQLAGEAIQQSFGGTPGLGGTLVPEESEEDDEEEDDDDEDGGKKRKRAGAKGGAKKGGAAGSMGGKPSGSGSIPSGDRDAHTGRRKIRIEFIEDDSRRHITFSKRKAGIMKKAYELATLTGTQVLLLIVSQTGLVYTFTTPKLSPVVQQPAGRELIQTCLNAPDPSEAHDDDVHGGQAQGRPNTADQQQQQQHSSVSSGPVHLATGMHPSSAPSVYNAVAGFHDPRQQAALMGMNSVPTMTMSLPAHMHGMGAYGYSGMQQLVGHDTAIPYGSYGI